MHPFVLHTNTNLFEMLTEKTFTIIKRSQHNHGLVAWLELIDHPNSVTHYQLITQTGIFNLAINVLIVSK